MTATPTTAAPQTRLSARWMCRLHTLIAEGKGDGPEADIVHDAMDAPWDALTEPERDRLGGLSEDLHGLADGTIESAALTPAERKQWEQAFRVALGSRHWDRLLEFVRHPPGGVAADVLRRLQAECWEKLGESEVALVFLRETERLNPTHSHEGCQDSWQAIVNVPV